MMMMNDSDHHEHSLPLCLNCSEVENGFKYCQTFTHDTRALSVLQINARSIKNKDKFSEFLNYTESFENKLDIIVVSESWLQESDPLHMYSINGYNSEFWCRAGKAGGGIVIYVADDLSYTKVNKTCISYCENGWIEVKTRTGEIILLGAIYRPPDHPVKEFMECIENFAVQINRRQVQCVIVGDIKIDINSNTEYANLLAATLILYEVSKYITNPLYPTHGDKH